MGMIDVHAHFYTERSGRADWREVNASRLRAGERAGIAVHVASILGTWGRYSPTYFPSRPDVAHANTAMYEMAAASGGTIRAYTVVNPNYTEHALEEIARGAAAGAVGIKLAASRRANDPLLDPVAVAAAERRMPVLHHIWQHRRREWPGQEASDGAELAELARRHPDVVFILAHIGGGGAWSHSLRAVAPVPNVVIDLSGSGVDAGMLEAVVDAVGVSRMVWGCDLTIDTGLAKARYLECMGLSSGQVEAVTGGNARRIFPEGAFP